MNRSKIFIYLLCVSLLLSVSFLSYADSFAILLEANRAVRDGRGTDVTNIYTITTDYVDASTVSSGQYLIIYYIDDQFIEEFKDKSLPFSFRRNFKGFSTGAHDIRIDIEDDHDNVLASQTVTINVLR